jgi:enamine deaminase RidA (YjgF/YER057c/UK114 family)
MGAESKIAELKLQLPTPPAPAGVYKPVVQVGTLCYVSGHGPLKLDGTMICGKVGSEVTEAEAKEAARAVGLAILASLKAHLGSLDRVVQLVKSLGMVNAVPDFERHPQVINGYSELMREVFGENGVGARSAVGMGSLPGNISVEIEAIFEVVG